MSIDLFMNKKHTKAQFTKYHKQLAEFIAKNNDTTGFSFDNLYNILKPNNSKIVNNLRDEEVITVFTDGSSTNNGKPGCTAGWGIYFPHNEF